MAVAQQFRTVARENKKNAEDTLRRPKLTVKNVV
jgi:hypothetical protein